MFNLFTPKPPKTAQCCRVAVLDHHGRTTHLSAPLDYPLACRVCSLLREAHRARVVEATPRAAVLAELLGPSGAIAVEFEGTMTRVSLQHKPEAGRARSARQLATLLRRGVTLWPIVQEVVRLETKGLNG